jgi:FtsP/CotA-like multicopper oxidase with cupredoxin domain
VPAAPSRSMVPAVRERRTGGFTTMSSRIGSAAPATVAAAVTALALAMASAGTHDPGHSAHAQAAALTKPGKLRTYYIAADEVRWDYAPQGHNLVTGRPFTDDENVFVGRGAQRIGSAYKKALYREYTDGTFRRLKPRAPEWQHLGMLGPVIQAEVGDTIRVVFRNNATRPYSIHAHGVFYAKNAEGAPYDDGTAGADKHDDAVPPGDTHVYTWQVPPRAGPGPHDGSSVMWMYHSHTDEVADTNSGLVGPMIITAAGQARPDGSPVDVDRQFVAFFDVMDENQSHYLDDNIAGLPDAAHVDPDDEEFGESNLMHSINGYVYGNGPAGTSAATPAFQARNGERVRWYLMSLGTEVDLHTPHWHGQTVTVMGMRTDVAQLIAGGMQNADMTADDPGIWLFHCHVNDHILAGMQTRYQVTP